MNYPKIALLVALGLMATACGNNKDPNALSPSPATIATPSVSTPEPTPTVAPSSPVAPLPGGEPPLVPGTIPDSGVRPPGSSSINNSATSSTDNSAPRRRKTQVKKVAEPAPKVTYSDSPVRNKPGSKPAKERNEDDGEEVEKTPRKSSVRPGKTVKERNEGSAANERAEEKPKKSPTKPAKTPRNDGDEDEKVPEAKPAKPAKAEADTSEGKKSNKLARPTKAEADITESRKQRRSAQEAENKN